MANLFNSMLLSSFNPRQFSGLQWWHSAADPSANGTRPANLSSIATLVDKGTLGNNATQANASDQPTFLTNQLNGKPIIAFDGTTEFLQATNGLANITTNMTYYVVASFPNIIQQSCVLGDSATVATNRLVLAFPYNAGGVKYIIDFGNIGAGGRLIENWSQSYNTYYVFTIVVNSAGSITVYLNGALLYNQPTVSTFNPAGLSAFFGKFVGTGTCLQYNFAEQFCYNTAHTVAQIAVCTQYLRNYWGI